MTMILFQRTQSGMMKLENETIRLRAPEPEDLEILYRWENDTSLWLYGDTRVPYSKFGLRQYIEHSIGKSIYELGQIRFMISHTSRSKTIGIIDLFDFDPANHRAGVGILIFPDEQGKGYAFKSLQLLHSYAFDFLDLHQLYAHISTDNNPCLRLFAKAGYRCCGRLNEWKKTGDTYQDIAIYQCIKKQ